MDKVDTFTLVSSVVLVIVLMIYGVMGPGWGFFFVLCVAFQCGSSKKAPAKPHKRTGVRFLDALAFFGMLSLLDDDDDDDGWNDWDD